METVKKNISEIVSGNIDVPQLTTDNREFAKIIKEAKHAFDVWKWVDRDSEKLNKSLDKLRSKL